MIVPDMFRLLLPLLIATASISISAAEPMWMETFDGEIGNIPQEVSAQIPGRGGVVHIAVPPGAPRPESGPHLVALRS